MGLFSKIKKAIKKVVKKVTSSKALMTLAIGAASVYTFGGATLFASLSPAANTAIMGAGAGALSSAVTGGSISEGMLFGAAGGLAMGYGATVAQGGNMNSFLTAAAPVSSAVPSATATAYTSTPAVSAGGAISSVSGTTTGQGMLASAPAFGTAAAPTVASGAGTGLTGMLSKAGAWAERNPMLATGAMVTGGNALANAFSDPEGEAMAKESARQFDYNAKLDEERSEEMKEASNYAPQAGRQVKGESVTDQVRNRRTGYNREDAIHGRA